MARVMDADVVETGDSPGIVLFDGEGQPEMILLVSKAGLMNGEP